MTDPSSIDNVDKSRHARLIISLLILILALISLIILRINKNSFWTYTAILCLVVAILHIGLNVFLNFATPSENKPQLWRHVLYWVGVLAAVYIDELMLQHAAITSVEAGLFALLILALGLYFIGLLNDLPLVLVAITIALMVTGSIVIQAYVLLVIVPITIIMGILIVLLMRKNKDRNEV